MVTHSKSFYSHVALLLLIAFFNACSKNVDKAGSAETATFFVDQVEGTSEISKVDSVYAIPKERLYNFKACLKDIMQSKAILGQSFKLEGGDSEKILESDEQGCLNWTESFEYNFLAQSNYIKINRTVIANGLHKGEANVQFAINPWARGDEVGVVDPKKKSVVSLSEGNGTSAFLANSARSPLWAIAPRVSILEQEFSAGGAKMLLKFQTKLSLVLKDSASQNIQYPISNGAFDVELILYNSINENGKETLIPIASNVQNALTFTQDTLIAEFPFTLNTLPNKGQILLGVKINASSNDIGLDSFDGIYLVSSSPSIKIDGSPSPVKNQSFADIKEKLAPATTEDKTVKKEDVKPGLEVDKLDIRFFKIGSETTTDRQVFFNVKTCITSNLDKRPIRDEDFLVQTLTSKGPVTLKSNQDGCISWDDSIWHKVFNKEQFIKKTIQITNAGFNLNQKINLIINPWDNGSNFGRDERFVTDFNSVNVNPSTEGPKILFDNYGFAVVNYKYEINKNLDLTVIKNGILSLSAKVVNHSSLSNGREGIDPLRDGNYLLKWSVITLDGDDKVDSVISSGEKAVNVFGGDIKTDLSFKVSAFDKLNVRSRLVIALYTIKNSTNKNAKIEIDRTSGLEATPYIGTIILNRDEEGQKMVRVENNLSLGKGDIFDRLATVSSAAVSSVSMDKVLARQNLKKLNLSNDKDSLFLRDGLANPTKYYTLAKNPAYYHAAEQKPVVAATTLSAFAKSGKLNADLASQFCAFWFNDYFRRLAEVNKSVAIDEMSTARLTQSCIAAVKKDPSRFFKTEKKLLVKKVGNNKYVSGTSTNFSVGNSFNVSKTEANTKSSTWSWTTSAGLSLEFFDVFKVGTTGSYGISSTNAKTSANASSASISSSTYMLLQTSVFNVELTAYEECTSIKLSPELFTGQKAAFNYIFTSSMKAAEIAKVVTSGLFLCTGVDNTTPIVKKESYYLVSQDMSSRGGELDASSAENQQLFMTFRGQKDLVNFLSVIQASVKDPSAPNSFNTSSSTGLLSMGALPTWPGIYSDSEN